MTSGVLTAGKILKRDLLDDLEKLYRQIDD